MEEIGGRERTGGGGGEISGERGKPFSLVACVANRSRLLLYDDDDDDLIFFVRW